MAVKLLPFAVLLASAALAVALQTAELTAPAPGPKGESLQPANTFGLGFYRGYYGPQYGPFGFYHGFPYAYGYGNPFGFYG